MYSPVDNILTLEGEEVHLRKTHYQGDISTYLWEEQRSDCLQTIEKIYEGPGRLYTPAREGRNQQILVSDDYLGCIFENFLYFLLIKIPLTI